jgi:hypothetical protein
VRYHAIKESSGNSALDLIIRPGWGDVGIKPQ